MSVTNWKEFYEAKLKDGSLAREVAARSGLHLAETTRRLPPAFDSPGALTAEDRETVIAVGKDPVLFEKTRGARNLSDYSRRKAAALALTENPRPGLSAEGRREVRRAAIRDGGGNFNYTSWKKLSDSLGGVA
jgi:hypothetical protein